MKPPKFKRYFKKCEEFMVCAEIGEKGVVAAEHHLMRNTLYQYGLYGSGRFAKVFDSDYVEVTSNGTLYDIKHLKYDDAIFQSYEDFSMIGFNSLTKEQDWDGELITESFRAVRYGYLICFDGHPTVNGIELSRYDYSKLILGKQYDVSIKDGDALALFSRV